MARARSRACDVCNAAAGASCPIDGVCARDTPTFEQYFGAMESLATLLRKALDQKGSVTRGEIRKALARYEKVRDAAS